MSGPADGSVGPVITALVARLKTLAELTDFSIADRAGSPFAQPSLRLGPVRQTPWNTATNTGAQITLSAVLATQTGSFALCQTATSAIQASLATPLTLTEGTCVLADVRSARFEHDTAQDLELATLSIRFLIDFGDPA